MSTEPTENYMALLTTFAKGRISAKSFHLSPEHRFEQRWRPRVAGRYVRNAADPELGFLSEADALEAARTYRDGCIAALQAANAEK